MKCTVLIVVMVALVVLVVVLLGSAVRQEGFAPQYQYTHTQLWNDYPLGICLNQIPEKKNYYPYPYQLLQYPFYTGV